ncbi:MAG: hypothetical protein ACK4EX_11005 [Thermaurantimonas sp.]|uniref:hypothetical protein n=1 Tax=Thermaurantimonas sp. TaxID=2681568 RepID=UPI003919744D
MVQTTECLHPFMQLLTALAGIHGKIHGGVEINGLPEELKKLVLILVLVEDTWRAN